MLSTLALDGGSGPVEIADVDIRAGGRKVDVEIENDTNDGVTGVRIRYRCKKGTGGVRPLLRARWQG